MLEEPKGIKYWVNDRNGVKIDPRAPKWAKDEFKVYQKLMSAGPDKKGTIKLY